MQLKHMRQYTPPKIKQAAKRRGIHWMGNSGVFASSIVCAM